MAHETFWYVDKRVIGTRFWGEVTEADLLANGEKVEALLADGIDPIFLVIDAREGAKMSVNFSAMIKQMGKMRPSKRIQWTIALSTNPLFNFFGVLASNVMSIPTTTFRKQADADLFLLRLAPDLADALASRAAKGD